MYTRVKLCADGFDRLHVQAAESFFHLLKNEFDAAAKLGEVAFGFQREGKVVHDAEERFDGTLHRVVAGVLLFLGFTLAGVFELGL